MHHHVLGRFFKEAGMDTVRVAPDWDETSLARKRIGVIAERDDEPASGSQGVGNVTEKALHARLVLNVSDRVTHAQNEVRRRGQV